MNYISIDLYKDFECIADKCPNTCCAGWSIFIDEETKQKMIDHEDALGIPAKDWLCERNNTTYAKLENNRCCMLNEKNLCNVVLKLGPEYLSQTCQQYPRLQVQYGNVIEAQLNMSCPEVISKLMDKDCVQFDYVSDGVNTENYEYRDMYFYEYAVRTSIINIMDSFSDRTLKTRLYTVYKVLDHAIELYKRKQWDHDVLMTEVSNYFQENILLSLELQLETAVSSRARLHFVKELQTVLESIKLYEDDREMVEYTECYYSIIEEADYVLHWQLFCEVMKPYRTFYNNYWISHLFLDGMSIPDYEKAKDKIIYVAAEFCLIQSIALAKFVMNGGTINREEYTFIISRICRTMEHNRSFRECLTAILAENNAISLAGLMLMVLE